MESDKSITNGRNKCCKWAA